MAIRIRFASFQGSIFIAGALAGTGAAVVEGAAGFGPVGFGGGALAIGCAVGFMAGAAGIDGD
jgi:hypothetical protein